MQLSQKLIHEILNRIPRPRIGCTIFRGNKKTVTQPWTIMEICGGQTHSLVKYGLLQMLPKEITMVHGPGCPVCVTPTHLIDRAIYLAKECNVILCSFGDMLRVPGSEKAYYRQKPKVPMCAFYTLHLKR